MSRTINLTDKERAVLTTLVILERKDPDGAWHCYYPDILAHFDADPEDASVQLDAAHAVCAALRKRKLIVGQGTGKIAAAYYPTDKGREAIADA